eukprot:TRINITY_DN71000_c0_g1_i1.p1 TRINITY_DN71000_c0_g1~~TRINITY_DN71000_c0_g1_i1.p1  ORF type:complete len:594 (+),score=114.06 TRINITY_DN71000_c0_g1_i1:109-1890(+)
MMDQEPAQPEPTWHHKGKSYKRSPSVHSQKKHELDMAELASTSTAASVRWDQLTRRPQAVLGDIGPRRGIGSVSSGSPPPSAAGAWSQLAAAAWGGGWGPPSAVTGAKRGRALTARVCVAALVLAVGVESLAAAAGSGSAAATQSCTNSRRGHAHGTPGCAAQVLRTLGCLAGGAGGAAACYCVLCGDLAPPRRRIPPFPVGAPLVGVLCAAAALATGVLLRFVAELWVLHDVWTLPVLPKLTGPYCNMQRVVVPRGSGDWGDVTPGTLAIACLWQRGFWYFRVKECAAAVANSLGAAAAGLAALSRGETAPLRVASACVLAAVAFGAIAEGYLLPSETAARMGAAPPAPASAPAAGSQLRPFYDQLEWKLRLSASGALVEGVAAGALSLLLACGSPDAAPAAQLGVAVIAVLGGLVRFAGEAAQLTPLKLWTQHSALAGPALAEVLVRVAAELVLASAAVLLAVLLQRCGADGADGSSPTMGTAQLGPPARSGATAGAARYPRRPQQRHARGDAFGAGRYWPGPAMPVVSESQSAASGGGSTGEVHVDLDALQRGAQQAPSAAECGARCFVSPPPPSSASGGRSPLKDSDAL